MSSDTKEVFTKDNLDTYLRELAKEYRKRVGKAVPAEIVLIGGAAILANYGFRDMTTDVDAVIHAASSMKDAINSVGDRFGLPNGWLNADFMRTASYTPRLDQYSTYYKTFSEEQRAQNTLIEFEQDYPGSANENNVDSILASMKAKRDSRTSILEQLQKMGDAQRLDSREDVQGR